MTTWPNTIPADLRRQLDAALSQRSVGAPDIWGEVRDRLIKHGVEAPGPLPEDAWVERGADDGN